MSTTRRTILRGIAALPATMAPAAIASVATGPDAALIARAAAVLDFAVCTNAAMARCCELNREADNLKPPRPNRMKAPSKFETSNERGEDGSLTIRMIPKVIDPAALLAFEQQTAARDAWEAERDAVQVRIGLNEAEAFHGELYDELADAVSDLASMKPATLAGIVAKARVAVELDFHGDNSFNDWGDEFRSSILRDLVIIEACRALLPAIGGVA